MAPLSWSATASTSAASGCRDLPFTEALRPLTAGTAASDGRPADQPDAGPGPVLGLGLGAVPTPGGELSQLQLFDGVASMLAKTGLDGVGPALLVIEDLHWADQSTRDLFAFLVGRLREERLLIVGSYRTDDLHRRHPLRPLVAQLDSAARRRASRCRSLRRGGDEPIPGGAARVAGR